MVQVSGLIGLVVSVTGGVADARKKEMEEAEKLN